MGPIIKIKNLSVVYDKGTSAETLAVSDIDFEVYQNEFVVIFGPSGCGKSTLLYAIAGIEENIEKGNIWIKDKNLSNISKKDLISLHRNDIGMVFQAYNLIPTLNVIDNITLPLVAKGVNKKIRKKKAKFILSRLGILKFEKRFTQYLSGGQQQRVGIARALINDPDIILADEPTGNLDSRSAQVVIDTLIELNKNDKKTIILVSHDPIYLSYAHKVFYMKDGKIIKREVREDVEKKKEVKIRVPKPSMQPKEKPLLLPETASTEKKFFNTQAMAHYFDWSFNSDEHARFENILKQYIQENISKEKFFNLLDLPFKEGGMGLYRQKAFRLSNEIEEIINLSKSLRKCIDEKKDIKEKVSHIVEWLLNDYHGKIIPSQEEKIENAALKRINGQYGREQFQSYLDISIDDGGAGLNWQTARNLSRKMEMILG